MAATVTQKYFAGITTDLSTSITVDSGTNIGLIACTVYDMSTNTQHIENIKYAGQPFYRMRGDYVVYNAINCYVDLWYMPLVTAQTANFTVTYHGGTNNTAVLLLQVSEMKVLSPDTGFATNTATSASSPDADVAISASSLVLNWTMCSTSGTGSAGSGWTIGNSGTGVQLPTRSCITYYAYKEFTGAQTTTNAEIAVSGTTGATVWKTNTQGFATDSVPYATIPTDTIAVKNMRASKRRYRP